MLNNSSLNSQLNKSEKYNFHFSFKADGLPLSALPTQARASRSAELISACLYELKH
jgi:hypothetical protein